MHLNKFQFTEIKFKLRSNLKILNHKIYIKFQSILAIIKKIELLKITKINRMNKLKIIVPNRKKMKKKAFKERMQI